MSTILPEDLIAGILSRLPVKDLLRFRIVSKRWRSLIDGQNFIKLHLATQSHHRRGAIIRDRELYWIHLRSPGAAAKIPNPIADAAGSTEVVGSCNGLVVLTNAVGDVALWNPATRRHQRIPIPRAESEFRGLTKLFFNGVSGFGHDPLTDEYKVLRMVVFSCKHGGEDGINTAFKIYSPIGGAKKWRSPKTETTSSVLGCFRRGHALVRNAFHWLVIHNPSPEKNPGSIVAFDVGSEQFREIASPKAKAYGRGGFEAKLVELRGCLCVACHYRESSRHVVWMMEDYGVTESWSKLLSVGPTEMGGPFIYVVPAAFVDDDRVLFEKDGNVLVLYDLRSKSAEFVRISGVAGYTEVSACVESLVRLDWDTADLEKEKPAKHTGKKRYDDFLSKGFKLKL